MPAPNFNLPVNPPIDPMLAKLSSALPDGSQWIYEPKWDGFRAIVFRDGDEMFIQSRDLKPLDRYFPELVQSLKANLPARCVVDGEIVIAGPEGLDFDALQLRLHPAASRVNKLAAEQPSSFVAFDLLAIDDENLMTQPQSARRQKLESAFANVRPPIFLTPATRNRALAERWFSHFEGAGLDGVMAKEETTPYQPGKRAMLKVKHVRTADCVVAGFRWHKNGKDELLGSLLLGVYNAEGQLEHLGAASAFTMAMRKKLVEELAPLRVDAEKNHPWADWGQVPNAEAPVRMPGAPSRWSSGKDMSWQLLRPERVVEVKYDHLQGRRFRHAAHFLRWRPDKPASECRFDQLEVTPPAELAEIFGKSK